MYMNSMKIHLKICRINYIYSLIYIYVCVCVCCVLYGCTRACIFVGR